MRSRKVTAHYCDHCNKRGFQIPAMEKHEKRCTRNIDRECGMCSFMAGRDGHNEHDELYCSSKTTRELIEMLTIGSEEEVKAMRMAAGDCPACVMAAVNFHNKKFMDHLNFYHSSGLRWIQFDWKEEKAKWDAVKNQIFKDEAEEYYDMVGGGY